MFGFACMRDRANRLLMRTAVFKHSIQTRGGLYRYINIYMKPTCMSGCEALTWPPPWMYTLPFGSTAVVQQGTEV